LKSEYDIGKCEVALEWILNNDENLNKFGRLRTGISKAICSRAGADPTFYKCKPVEKRLDPDLDQGVIWSKNGVRHTCWQMRILRWIATPHSDSRQLFLDRF
jgi:hypothetical protein